ncbi:TRAP transporter small permease [Ruegeria marina]|uniref:TRAP transporter small permease protein n=1 Tax=Ruegeria marina TaxID=639004 RepID=A0A1G7FGJ9_9RHOB|nr:TRAP transporter small permease subunit [Ruegeria marina]SDE74665.1 Tripartite ATP-independent transporter, DctQ component [Ruegeria marina]
MAQQTPQPEDITGGPRRVLTIWHKAECWIAFAAFLFISVIIVYDVIAREVIIPILQAFDLPTGTAVIRGASKLGVYGLIVGAFFGLGIATASGAQIVPKVAFGWVPKAWGPLVDRASDVFSGAFFLAAAWIAFLFVQSSRDLGMLTSGGVRIEVWFIQAVMPLGFASVGLRYLCYAIWPDSRPILPEFAE